MNFKNISIVASVASVFAMTLIAIPFAAKADIFNSNSNSSSQIIAQTQPLKRDKKAYFEKFAQELGLTDAQKSDLARIRNNTRTEIDRILTPEQRQQRQQRQATSQNRQGRRNGGFKALNLTEDQKANIRRVMQASKSDMEAVLTPEQKQKFEQLRQDKRNIRQQRQQSNGVNR
ncbi:MAG: P pilus assembly/Cpx signaling pathway, periplasmic inhibitor/zinc-resistance associated protein [Methylacidiphilales bacterium]|nr:P pilus assembly/Cpx signaling pathway, periplasmic inhibitor/zinc-resistance associated protein [Candidatus Methylacidiphilales bacterium]NJR14757.1 P pilus assembly/Cpx signaling pathway, periplasmic inhibitor/zinc-resistance associated protein [Calothrix sp. CSU_2_0]